MNRPYLFLLIFFFICGCSPELNTLITISREQEAQNKYLATQSKYFKTLLSRIEDNKLKLGLSAQKIISYYGEPIVVKDINSGRRFLYREPVDFNPKKKVYLYFDPEDKLVDFELIVREEQEEPLEESQAEIQEEPQEEILEEPAQVINPE
ncbi:MAG: hypothetical protein ABIA97_06085 [Candidatus Omnitrophota bacterium]